MTQAQTAKPETADSLMAEADALLNQSIPQIQEATSVLRRLVALDPDHLYGLHSLNWCLDSTRRFDPATWERELRDEHWRARDRVLELTRSPELLQKGPRARSLALSLWAEERVMGAPTDAELDAIEAALDEAASLRELPDHERGRRGVEAWRQVRRGDTKDGYAVLLARIAAQPDLVVFDHNAEDAGRAFHGLEGAFSDPGFHAWLEAQSPPARPKGTKALDAALLLAAGGDASPFFGPGRRSGGRTGRVLAIRALGGGLTTTDREKRTLLHLAAMIDDGELVRTLLRLGVTADARNDQKKTALHLAAEYDSVSCLPALAERVPTETLDDSGRTALFDARSVEVARALLDAGADPNGGEGRTPLHQMARHSERAAVAALLLARGGDPNAKDTGGRTPLEEALDFNNAAVATVLGGGSQAPSTLAIDTLLEAAETRGEAIVGAWYFEAADLSDLRDVLETARLAGDTTWDQVAARTAGLAPWHAMALVELARDALESNEQAKQAPPGARFVLGSLEVQGDLHLSAPLLVTGDLVVHGVLRNAGPEGTLYVGGSLQAGGVDTDGELWVAGDLSAPLVWAHHNDPSLGVGGKLIAQVLIIEDQAVEADIEATHLFRDAAFKPTSAKLKKRFVKNAFGEEGLDREALFGLLSDGKPALL